MPIRFHAWKVQLALCLPLVLHACGDSGGGGMSARDAGDADGSSLDSGSPANDGATSDAPRVDGAGPQDGATDAAIPEDATADATSGDAGIVDPTTSLAGPLGSGTRIQTEVITTERGPETAVGYYDTQRSESCEIAMATDGVFRCLPSNAYSESRLSFFRDDGCTDPVHLVSNRDTCPMRDYVRVTDGTMCPMRSAVYPVGEAAPEGAPLYVRDNDGSCREFSTNTSSPYLLGPEVAATEFASASVVELARTEALVVEILETEDGTRTFHRIALTDGDTCTPAMAEDEVPRCLPTGTSVGTIYSDDACTTTLGMVSGSARCDPPGHAYELGTGCHPTRAIRQVTGEFEGQAYRESSTSGECQTSSWPFPLVTLGDHVAPATFPETPEETGPGTRLVERRHVVADGVASRIALHDTQLDADCTFLPDANGDLRCIPFTEGTVVAGVYFRDSGCGIPLVSDANPCPNAYAVRTIRSEDCSPTRYEVYEVGARYTGNVYFRTGGFCTRATAPGQFGLAFFTRGDRVAPEDMVLGTMERR